MDEFVALQVPDAVEDPPTDLTGMNIPESRDKPQEPHQGAHHLRGSSTVKPLSTLRVCSAVKGMCKSSTVHGGEARRCDVSQLFCNGLNSVPHIASAVLAQNVAICGDRHLQSRLR